MSRIPTDDLNSLDVLPPGTRFGELEIVRTVGVGGFGIVYLAQDHALQRQVAIKEYMPGQLAQRGGGSQVSVRAGSLQETFDIGRRSFVNEARLLARFDHRALLKVYQFWEANGTAYMAMPYLQGLTLRQTRQAMKEGRPDEAWMLNLLLPLLDGLTLLHAEGVLHRDIAPDNILLPTGGSDPILLDFGAARHAIGDRTQTLTAILKPSYAPIEQYAEATTLRQGPWTDLYALGAVAHYVLTGRPPPPSTARAVADDYVPLAGQALPGLSRPFLAAIDAALAVRPQDRPQSAGELRRALRGEQAAPILADARTVIDLSPHATATDLDLSLDEAAPPLPSAGSEMRAERVPTAAGAKGDGRGVLIGAGLLFAALALGAAWWWWQQQQAAPLPKPAVAAALPTAAPPSAPDAASAASAVEPAASAVAVAASAVVEPPSAPTVAVAVAAAASKPAPKLREASSNPSGPKPRLFSLPPPSSDQNLPLKRSASPPPMPRQDGSMTLPTPPAEAVAPQKAPALAERATSQPAAPDAALSLREVCSSPLFILKQMCINRECQKPAFAGQPECVRLHEADEQRKARGN